ncbi:NAD(P)/FAD-dependent oxidoreductase [Mucilaginibacter flavidus]|uniref:NAD(P)/FAD-dependent oxidoreductase n=1 Tax=Mucilaginibacter flavidus TaxID=2949309 RepID=UPI0020924ED4|nr:NAD(P)/FAD-dependent oxidoreductase [Mucilaginibacter flavidus]MCO5949340.1 NAD(P)/FAD-dependent oxidoreductase [Mucilaginibacter flavidus]
MNRKKIVIVGGGFAGIQFIEHLDQDLFEVLLIDKLNYHQFQPLFYQVATSQLEPSSISFPLRKIFQNRKNTQIRMTKVLSVEPRTNSISTTIGSFNYDYLVVATGCKTNFFGNMDLEKYAYGLKTTYDAIKIRNKILQSFEDLLSVDESEKEYLLNIVIVGAGPTGVELAGAFAEIKKNILPKDFPLIDFKNLKVILLEGGLYTLSNMSDMAKKASENYLKILGVDVKTNVIVKSYDGKIVTLNNGECIKSKHVIWTAGVTGNIISGIDEKQIVNNRIKVDRYNLAQGYSNIYAIGDIAYMETPAYLKGHPQVANVAINQAKNLAKNFKSLLQNKPLRQYEYTNLGVMATIGKNKAVVDLPFIKFKGYFAWFIWMFLHLMLILSVRNKLIIFINWVWIYITKDSSLRLILKENDR